MIKKVNGKMDPRFMEYRDELLESIDPETVLNHLELRRAVDGLLKTLTPKEERMVEMHFGLHGYEPQTYYEIGQSFETTRDEVRRIIMRALRKLGHPSRSNHITAFKQNAGGAQSAA